jgi:hypothetical protein
MQDWLQLVAALYSCCMKHTTVPTALLQFENGGHASAGMLTMWPVSGRKPCNASAMKPHKPQRPCTWCAATNPALKEEVT